MNSTFIIRKVSLLKFVRSYAKKYKFQPVVQKSIQSIASSIGSKGFLRSIKPYTPPENVSKKIKNILSKMETQSLTDLNIKFQLLNACFREFNHSIPNSELHAVSTIDDVINFYETPVNTITPYDALKDLKLPENLHVQQDYIRFNPETDTIFNGQTAFPKSSTLVTGLKYRKKYQGYVAKRSWP